MVAQVCFLASNGTKYAGRAAAVVGWLDGRFVLRGWIALAVPALVLGTLVAQTPSGAPDVVPIRSRAVAPGSLGPPVVIHAPYSAEMVSTFDKVLPSGKHVHGETHGKAYRDSQGRTRKDADAVGASGAEPNGVLVFIVDPVEHRNIELDSRTMTAHVSPWQVATKPIAVTGSPPPGGSTESAGAAAASSTALSATLAAPASVAPVLAGPGEMPTDGPAVGAAEKKTLTSEDLGTREMEGLTVWGTKLTVMTHAPDSENGRSNAVVLKTVVEWEARDMGVVVLKETDDARSGHFATKLVHIVRTEPDAALFQIPTGYSVIDNRPQ